MKKVTELNQIKLDKSVIKQINEAVEEYKKNKPAVERMAKSIYNMLGEFEKLKPLTHSLKFRVKDSDHLKEKLIKKAKISKRDRKKFDINNKNIFKKVTDLAGVRILHLHTKQMKEIDMALRELFTEQALELVEGPVANTWDPEYTDYFKQLKMIIPDEKKKKNIFYTSVHYIISANDAAKTRCEIQVRTLMEEVWGEVSHTIDYPTPSASIACREQIKVLARVTSSGTRLVDSIFSSHEEFEAKNSEVKKK